MTAPGLSELAGRAVACKAWQWLPGMRVFVAAGDGSGWARVREDGKLPSFAARNFGPDLGDFATLGAIEHGILAPLGVWIFRSRDQNPRSRVPVYFVATYDEASRMLTTGEPIDNFASALVAALEVATEHP